MKRCRVLFPLIAAILSTALLVTPLHQGYEATSFDSDINMGPYVDMISYKVIDSQDGIMLALQTSMIEMTTSYIDPVYLQPLEADPNIDIHSVPRNGYGHITINCRDYPLNISALRRAFAYAYDKARVITEGLDGFGIEHDSLVPRPNGWCIEDELDWHYYDARPDIGNAILNAAGFEIDVGTGYRLAPDGSAFEINIEYIALGSTLGYSVTSIAVDALTTLHIDSRIVVSDYNEYRQRLEHHEAYDMIYYAVNFDNYDVDWLAYDFWSEYADVDYQNPCNFANDTYDGWRNQLLHGTTYEEVYEAAAEMQKILHYNVPRLVVYENIYLQPYRTDKFSGHIEDHIKGISGPWTMRQIKNLNGSTGGTVSIGMSGSPDSFNIFVATSDSSKTILSELWPSLYRLSPDATPWHDLAKSLLIETHSDNPAVPEGHTRFTIDTIQNATWTDGTPLTAEDVAYTFTYIYESNPYGNPAATTLSELVGAHAPTTYRVILEFGTESYWHFSNFAYLNIIPKHIFQEIGYVNWHVWNPVFAPSHPNVNCGPFVFTNYMAGEYYEILRNPNFHYRVESTTTNTSSTMTNQTNNQGANWPLMISSSISTVSIVIILYCIVSIVRVKRKE